MDLIPNKTILTHKNTNRDFLYLGVFKPQFALVPYVKLKNTKTGNIESFLSGSYMNFFKIKFIE